MAGWLARARDRIFILKVPSYGNSIFYSLGFLALTCLAVLTASGLVMVFFGSAWWLANPWGIFLRSIHLWAAQAFILIILLHALVVFLTSGFKPPRRLTWVLGAVVAVLAVTEAEFGYGLRGDFSSQYRSLQAADFWNGSYLGKWVNVLNNAQMFGVHVVIIPFVIFALLGLHYLRVKTLGIAKPYRNDIHAPMVAADHKKLFLRGSVLFALIIVLAYVFPSPLILPTRIAEVADENPALMAQTLAQEFARTSHTATYSDSIDPYAYDTRAVYVMKPYEQYVAANNGAGNDLLAAIENEPEDAAVRDAAAAEDYFANGGAITAAPDSGNPLIPAISSLVSMAKSGIYESAVDAENPGIRPTYSLRFLADTGVLDDEAQQLRITTDQWGMMREEKGSVPPGAWWLAPLGVLDHTILANDPNGDRDGAEILGLFALLFVLFPYLPYLNRLPEKLHLAEIIWRS
ncbi:MAG: cytochrome b N-terminal domain-containing protein [Patescibacteria group bacterium]|nr:cytochrome b N-terminal domain-containing protein [Patescibacteria group bacterium]